VWNWIRSFVAAVGIASSKVVLDLLALGGAGGIVGTSGGWVVGLVAEATRKGKLEKTMAWGTGAGTTCGVLIAIFDRVLY
jgi:hypothetical protein